jgi:hypothetical protein
MVKIVDESIKKIALVQRRVRVFLSGAQYLVTNGDIAEELDLDGNDVAAAIDELSAQGELEVRNIDGVPHLRLATRKGITSAAPTLGVKLQSGGAKAAGLKPQPGRPREFNVAERSMIHRLHGFMAPEQLLSILNDRLVADIGEGAVRYSMDNLYAEIKSGMGNSEDTAFDWANLRKRLAAARKSGLLDQIDAQVIEDFAVVFSINTRQAMTLKDILLQDQDQEEE